MSEDLVWWRRPKLLAAVVCAALGVLVLAFGPLLRAEVPAPAAPLDDLSTFEEASSGDMAAPESPADLIVYVSGAVARPDVYRLPAGARVKDAVLAAGGLLDSAVAEQVNLAAPLSDAEQIHIPRIDEAPVDGPAGAPAADGRLDLNLASAADLEELPGIGATLAGRIIARREEQGPFGSVEELREVTGVGEKLFAQIAPLLVVGRSS